MLWKVNLITAVMGVQAPGLCEYHAVRPVFMPRTRDLGPPRPAGSELPLTWHRLIGIYAFERLSAFFLMWDYRNIQGVRGFCSSARVTV